MYVLAGGEMQNDYVYDDSTGYVSPFNFPLRGLCAKYTSLVAGIIKCIIKQYTFSVISSVLLAPSWTCDEFNQQHIVLGF